MSAFLVTLLFKILLVVAALAVALKLYIIYYERRLLFFPVQVINQTPTAFGLEFEWRRFLSYDGLQLTGWWIKRESALATVLYFHGNAGNIGDRIQFLAYLYEAGFSVFVFDYRGYGESEGRPTEKGLLLDGDAAYEELTARIGIPPGDIVFFGRSMGGIIAAHTARGRNIRGLVLEGTFSSALEMANVIFAPFHIPRILVGVELNAAEFLKKRVCPLLVIHGTHDDVVPFAMGRKLYDAVSASDHTPKSFYAVERGAHNDCHTVGTREYLERLRAFSSAPPATLLSSTGQNASFRP